MTEHPKRKTMKLRHRLMSLCYVLKNRVILSSKQRNRLTKTHDARLLHPTSPSLKRRGMIKLLNIVARCVPHWAEVLPALCYHYDHNMQLFPCPPFLCFPLLHHRPPLPPTFDDKSANYVPLRLTPLQDTRPQVSQLKPLTASPSPQYSITSKLT